MIAALHPTRSPHVRKFIIVLGMAASIASGAATAQVAEVLVATGPGVAGAAGTVTVTGSITALDSATREITLLGEGGREAVLAVGPEAKNFDKLHVGDRVDLHIAKALKLELRKGSTAAISRTDETDAVDSGVPGKPGGAIGRKVVVMAEVTALDAATSTVTLKGPNHSLDLQVADPEQFKAIAVGDRVEATFVEAVAVEVTPVKAE
jgi:hypothetical protein